MQNTSYFQNGLITCKSLQNTCTVNIDISACGFIKLNVKRVDRKSHFEKVIMKGVSFGIYIYVLDHHPHVHIHVYLLGDHFQKFY